MERFRVGLQPVLVRMLDARVGSTLTLQLLASSPKVVLDKVFPFEHSYMTYFVRLCGQLARTDPTSFERTGFVMEDLLYGDRSKVSALPFDPEVVEGTELSSGALAALWAHFALLIQSRHRGACLYAEKYWGPLIPILEAGIEPIVIDLVRDPRDILASHLAFNARHGGRLFGRGQWANDDSYLRHIVGMMALRFSEMKESIPVARKTVRYEDLLTNPVDTCRAVSDLVGVNLDPSALQERHPDSKAHMTSPNPDASIGRWRRDLSAGRVRYIEQRLGVAMAAAGYDLSAVDRRPQQER